MSRTLKIVVVVVSLFVLQLPESGVFKKLKEINDTINVSGEGSINPVLRETNINESFVSKENMKTSFGVRNIVVILLESFEESLLDDANQKLTSNLRNRKETWTFYQMSPNDVSDWSMGSIYTFFTGLPALFPWGRSNFVKGVKGVNLVNLDDIVSLCGYEMYFLSGNVRFQGVDEMLKMFGVNHILDKTFGGKYPAKFWGGASDKNIFGEAKNILEKRRENQKMMVIQTIQTHFPFGLLDESLNDIVP